MNNYCRNKNIRKRNKKKYLLINGILLSLRCTTELVHRVIEELSELYKSLKSIKGVKSDSDDKLGGKL